MSSAVVALRQGHLRARAEAKPARRRGPTLLCFGLLCAYGALRWGTMFTATPDGQLLALALMSVLVISLGRGLAARRRELRLAAIVGIAALLLASIIVAGFPTAWVVNARVSVFVRATLHAISALPHVVVPFDGHSRDIRSVIVLGAGVLMLAAALVLCTPRERLGIVRLGAAALPLTVLAIVPSILAEPKLAAVHGIVLFAMLCGLLFSERGAPRFGGGVALVLGGGIIAWVLAPGLSPHHPWINVRRIGAGASVGERFNWQQTYGPLRWPRQGSPVLSIRARFGSYWKAEDLDLFDGRSWVSSNVGEEQPMTGVSGLNLARFTERLTVTLQELESGQMIAAGIADPPSGAAAVVQPGNGPGTWVSATPLRPGTSYHVVVYAPHPSPHELATVPASYPFDLLAPELQLLIPGEGAGATAQPLQFEPYGSRTPVGSYGGLSASAARQALLGSPYGRAFRLALRLRAGTPSPYAFVRAVLRYLARGFTYDQVASRGPYPLLSFLFSSRRGYCQQFAGAAALLLRMGGIPARVAAGFTPGTYDRASHVFDVTDLDAHAWVEVWFKGYGWVTVDPTPHADPALSDSTPGTSTHLPFALGQNQGSSPKGARSGRSSTGTQRTPRGRTRAGGGESPWPLIGSAAILALALFALALMRHLLGRRQRDPEALLAELERAYRRCGRPLPPQLTLGALALSAGGLAGDYVRALATARYSGRSAPPTLAQRRAMRRSLARELGHLGLVRAWLALPPRRLWREREVA